MREQVNLDAWAVTAGDIINIDNSTIALHLFGAVIAGGIIGFERTYHGHPAGFRTYALVCVASSLLMLITVYEWNWAAQHAVGRQE